MLYKNRKISTPEDAAALARQFLVDSYREMLVVISLDNKNQPNSLYVCNIGNLNSSIIHPREVFKSSVQVLTHVFLKFTCCFN